MITVRALRIGGPPGQPEGNPGETQRCRIGEHVTGIRDQRQGTRQHPPRHLHGHEATRKQHGTENPSLIVPRGTRMLMVM